MKKNYPLLAIFALFIFACGEIGEEDILGQSSGSGNNSSSPGGSETVCSGTHCCNGTAYDNTINFCHEDELYPLCGGTYNPYEKGCFDGKLYPKCEIETTRGKCVDNTLLRCRQEGKDNTYIKDPLPGMECKENGKIVGKRFDIRDGKIYEVAQIGSQIWMAENLNYDPSSDPLYTTEEVSMCYGNNPANCDKYGRMYDWATAMGLSSGCNSTDENCPQQKNVMWGAICPPDFYIASNTDWQRLVDYAEGKTAAGGRLKSTSGWGSGGNGTDSYGFNALPGGYFYLYDPNLTYFFGEEGSRGMWWSDTQHPKPNAYYWTVISSDKEIRNNFQSKGPHMAYVRCLHYF